MKHFNGMHPISIQAAHFLAITEMQKLHFYIMHKMNNTVEDIDVMYLKLKPI